MNIQLYILESNDKVIAISETKSDILKYIYQFQNYFDENFYTIKTEYEKSNSYLEKYMGRYLYDFSNSIILTDDEILYYRKAFFDEMYEEFNRNLVKIIYDPEILKLENGEKQSIIKNNTKYLETVNTFDKFINKFNNKVLRYYIREPILTFEL